MEKKDTPPPKAILLGIDLEEFDLPAEYGQFIDREQQLAVTGYGLRVVEKLLALHEVHATFFTTGWWAVQCPGKIKRLAETHEIASHTLYHNSFHRSDLITSRNILQRISGQSVPGIRMPRMGAVADQDLVDAGYRYNSSSHPTYLPGRYNGLRAPRLISQRGGLIQLPVSVSPGARIPVFWLAFRNFPYAYFLYLCRRILHSDGYLVLYFHPWEFADLSGFGLPWYVRRGAGEYMANRFARLINDLQVDGKFSTHIDWVAAFEKKMFQPPSLPPGSR